MKKLLIFGIIVLFIGLAFIPSFNAVSISKKDNNAPSKPTIAGPNGGRPGIMYTFNFNAVDPDGDNVSYFIKWGDGTTSGWTPYTWSGTNMPIAHTWDYICDCPIRAKAKDIYGKEGEWSDLIIRINRNKPQIIDIESTKGCDCQSNGKTHLAEKIFNRLEKNEVLSNVINSIEPQDDRPICPLLDYILDTIGEKYVYCLEKIEETKGTIWNYYYFYLAVTLASIGYFYAMLWLLLCYEAPYYP